jgi:hypothetical protein
LLVTASLRGGRPLRGQLQQNLTLPGLVSLLSGTDAVLRGFMLAEKNFLGQSTRASRRSVAGLVATA